MTQVVAQPLSCWCAPLQAAGSEVCRALAEKTATVCPAYAAKPLTLRRKLFFPQTP